MNSGVDCSGFTMAIHAKFDISIPRVTYGHKQEEAISNGSQQAGDLILYNSEETNDHVGILLVVEKVVFMLLSRSICFLYGSILGITQNTIRRYW